MDLVELRDLLHARSQRTDSGWLASLSERKRAELEFHNESKRTREMMGELPQGAFERLHGNKKYYSLVGSSRAYLRQFIARWAPGGVFLDYACGNGDQAIVAAQLGAALALGIDVSDVSVANARVQAEASGVGDRSAFLQDDCEDTGLPDGCIDVALCSGVLHHLDLSYAFPELRRILKPGGRVLAVEALDYNPAIRLYRKLTPAMRTEWEKAHICSLKDLDFARRFFDLGEVRYWHLVSLLAMFARWDRRLFDGTLRALDAVDALLLRVPGIRLLAWQFTFELVKRQER